MAKKRVFSNRLYDVVIFNAYRREETTIMSVTGERLREALNNGGLVAFGQVRSKVLRYALSAKQPSVDLVTCGGQFSAD